MRKKLHFPAAALLAAAVLTACAGSGAAAGGQAPAAGQTQTAAAAKSETAPQAPAGTEAAEAPGEEAHVRYTKTEGCDTFTQIVDQLEKGRGYANVSLQGGDVLLVAENTFEATDRQHTSMGAEVFVYLDGAPAYAGYTASTSSANPIAVKDGALYTGGHHFVRKSVLKDGQLVILEEASETFDAQGKATYHLVSGEERSEDQEKAKAALDRLSQEYSEAEMILFDPIS